MLPIRKFHCVEIFFLAFFIFAFSLLLASLFYWILFYIHEVGHGIFAFFLNLIFFHTISLFSFTRCVSLPLPNQFFNIFELPAPVQTNVSGNFPLIGFGGIFFTTLIILLLVIGLSKIVNTKYKTLLYCFPIIVFLEEFLMNILCGYDGSLLIPFPTEYCPNITVFVQNLVPILFTVNIFCILIIKFKTEYRKKN
jgi:hypothetical protein